MERERYNTIPATKPVQATAIIAIRSQARNLGFTNLQYHTARSGGARYAKPFLLPELDVRRQLAHHLLKAGDGE
jgi:hypothetical protein